MERVILHVDLNCFYASVAVREDPSLRGKPVAVVGEAEQRHGVVLAKTYEAKAYGVKTGQAIWQALQLCPELALCSVDFPKYRQVSRQIQQLYYEYTDQVEPFGTDECWLDVTSSAGLFGSGAEIADQIRGRIRREFGLTASVGVSFNKVFAKLGSDYRKPDATTVFSRENFRRLVWPLPVESLLYVGRATQGKLNRRGIQTIGQLAAAQPAFLRRLLGVNGQLLWEYANGLDRSRVGQYEKQPAPKSIGNSTTAPRDLVCDQDVRIVLRKLCDCVARRLRRHGCRCQTVQLWLRGADLQSWERQAPLAHPTQSGEALLHAVWQLYLKEPKGPFRSLGVRASELQTDQPEQISFLPEAQRIQRLEALERTLDGIQSRFGADSIRHALELRDAQLGRMQLAQSPLQHAGPSG
ncbi:MAG: DNA polymerase IV [Clostridiales bacterium]|nr:DNA polymerase IV [Clostridiales bacterium]